jgi:tetratricopeptide (TPR) repeat protein
VQTSGKRVNLGEIRDLHARGVAENNAGRPARAVRLLRRSLAELSSDPASDAPDARAAPDAPDALDATAARVLAGRIWLTLALAESELHGLGSGLAAMAHAQHYAATADDLALRILVHAQRGAIQLRFGALHDSLQDLDLAVALLDDAPQVDQCNMLLSRGYVHLNLGNLARSRADLALAAELAHESGLVLEDFKARHNLGYVEFLAGELPESLRIMDEAARLGADLPRGIPLLDRARVLVEAGLVSEADETLAEAEQIFARDRLSQDLGEVEVARAECALLAEQPAAARRLAVIARGRFRRRGNDRWRRRAELVILQADVARGRTGRVVEEEGRRLLAEFDAEGLRAESRIAAFVTAEALLDRGRPDAARAIADTVGPAKAADPIGARLHTGYLRARLARACGAPAKAAQHVRSSLAELAAYQARFGSIDMQTGSAIHGRRLAELGVAIALDERGRAVSSRLPAVRPPADQRTAELLADLRQTVEGVHVTPNDAGLQRRRRQLEREIKSRSWTIAGAGKVQRPASLGMARAAASSTGSTLVSFVRAAGSLHAVVLDARSVSLRSLGSAEPVDELAKRARADLDVLAHRLPAALRVAAAASLDRSLGALDDTLLKPLRLGSNRLVVVPTGILGALPWGAMPSCHGRPVSVTPSATAWLIALGSVTRPASGPDAVVAIAGPDLERSEHEVATLAGNWPGGRALTGSAGGREALAAAMAQATVVHIAAHGRHHTENPLFSSISLADGALFAYELDQTARCADHVILSACELGRSTIRPGDEALGLTSVLLHLGSRSVVAGVARVEDATAAQVMIGYHARLAAGRDSAEALAEALDAGAETPAPFVCFGAQWAAA